jgi:hypothetical protein
MRVAPNPHIEVRMSATGEAIRFWERGRVGYNLALTGLVAAWVIRTWPTFVGLAALANLFYCAAYFVEFSFLQSSAPETRRRWRHGLWLAGTLFALLIAQYWIGDEIYPSVLPGG